MGGGVPAQAGGAELLALPAPTGGLASATPLPRSEGAGRMTTFADSDRNRDPPPIRRYFLTRSRNSSACCRRYWRSCQSEQNLPPLRRTSRGSGCPHQRQWARDSCGLASVPPAGGSSSDEGCMGGATPKRCCRRKASACSEEQKPPWRRRISSGNSPLHHAQRFGALSVTATRIFGGFLLED